MIGSQFDGAIHHLFRRQIADRTLSVPLFNCAEAGYTFGLGIGNDIAVFQLLNETRETVDAVRINAGFGGAGERCV